MGLNTDVEPMVVKTYDDARPVRAAQRRYTPVKRNFMERIVRKSIEFGFVVFSMEAELISAP